MRFQVAEESVASEQNLPVFEMAPHVIFEVSFCSEGLPTACVRADVGALVVVYPLMNEQVVALAKRFLTSRVRAPVGVLPRVQIHVCLQAIRARKLFSASLHGAQKSLFWLLNRPSSPSCLLERILLQWLVRRLISWHDLNL